jgi:hypothetical protein
LIPVSEAAKYRLTHRPYVHIQSGRAAYDSAAFLMSRRNQQIGNARNSARSLSSRWPVGIIGGHGFTDAPVAQPHLRVTTSPQPIVLDLCVAFGAADLR